MAKTYTGKFSQLKNPAKYAGDISKIVYRSHWERNAFRWCDENPNIIEWSSEELAIPYENPLKGRARYYPDLILKMSDGQVRIIEIKPKKETIKPESKTGKGKRFVNESSTWMVNQAKWEAASKVAERNKCTFEIWTEDTLKEMGILKWETDKLVLSAESRSSNKPKMKPIRKNVKRPKRKS